MTDFEPPPPDPTTETSATPTPTQPVGAAPVLTPADAAMAATAGTPTTTTARRGSRTRWALAALVVALVVGASAVVALALTSTSKTSMVLGYAPADAVAYAEARLDLPGDQRQQVAAFLSHFPGFADQAALPTKINETLDQLVSRATDGKQTYTKDIEPWFSGQVAYVAGPLPASLSTGRAADVRLHPAADARVGEGRGPGQDVGRQRPHRERRDDHDRDVRLDRADDRVRQGHGRRQGRHGDRGRQGRRRCRRRSPKAPAGCTSSLAAPACTAAKIEVDRVVEAQRYFVISSVVIVTGPPLRI